MSAALVASASLHARSLQAEVVASARGGDDSAHAHAHVYVCVAVVVMGGGLVLLAI
jgi:hypothetical protein